MDGREIINHALFIRFKYIHESLIHEILDFVHRESIDPRIFPAIR